MHTGLIPYDRSQLQVTRKTVSRSTAAFYIPNSTECNKSDSDNYEEDTRFSTSSSVVTCNSNTSDTSRNQDDFFANKSVIDEDLHTLIVTRLKTENQRLLKDLGSSENLVKKSIDEKIEYQEIVENNKIQIKNTSIEIANLKSSQLETNQIILNLREALEEAIIQTENRNTENIRLNKSRVDGKLAEDKLLNENTELKKTNLGLINELENLNCYFKEARDKIEMTESLVSQHDILKNENRDLKVKSTTEQEAKTHLIKEGQSQDNKINSLSQRLKYIEADNGKLKAKCFEAAKIINDIGVESAALKDSNRSLIAAGKEMTEAAQFLENRVAVLLRQNKKMAQQNSDLENQSCHLMSLEKSLQKQLHDTKEALRGLTATNNEKSIKLQNLFETETTLKQRISDKNEIIQQQAKTIRFLQNQISDYIPRMTKTTDNSTTQTRIINQANCECQTAIAIIQNPTKGTVVTDQFSQTGNSDSFYSIQKCVKRYRQLEIAYMNTAQHWKAKKKHVVKLTAENTSLINTCEAYKLMIKEENLKCEEILQKLEDTKQTNEEKNINMNAKINELESAEQDARNRLYVAEITSARLLRRARFAETMLEETNQIIEQRRRRNDVYTGEKVDKQMKCLRARLKVLSHQVDQCTSHYPTNPQVTC